MDEYPRLLLVGTGLFIPHTGGGITLSNLFRGWPLDRIAAVHYDTQPYQTDVCEKFYPLNCAEMGWVWPFSLVQGRSHRLAGGSSPAPRRNASSSRAKGRSFVRGVARRGYRLIATEGLQDRACLSDELKNWLEEYRPEVIYSWLGSLGYIRLVTQIAELTGAPTVVHIMDDWPATMYCQGLIAPYFRKRMEQGLQRVFDQAAICMGICPSMCKAFEARYGRTFQSFSNALSMEDWLKLARKQWACPETFRIIYSGSIVANAQLDSLLELSQAVSELSVEGMAVELIIHSAEHYVCRYRAEFQKFRNVKLEGPLGDDIVAQALAAADLLALPVNFDERSVRYIRYSNPTKLPAYLISGSAILAYGPEGVDQVERARNDGWGAVVSERGVPGLKEAIGRLVEDETLREKLGRRGQEVARRDHDIGIVRPAFQGSIRAAAHSRID